MKVGIITMHCPLNYGAVLQTYALQKYIESLDCDVEVIDYRPNYIVYDQKLTFIANEAFNKNILLKALYIILKAPSKIKRSVIFNRFCNKYLHLSKCKYETFEQLESNTPTSDLYICGSDQIWNFSSGAYKDPAYFLGFVTETEKKISYAPSGYFPNPLPTEMEHAIVPRIKQFKALSVREDATRDILQPYVGKKITSVLDPVFLCDKSFWMETCKTTSLPTLNDKYILIYPVGDVTIVLQQALKLSKKTNLPIYCISASVQNIKGVKKKIMPTPVNFIKLFSDAEYVITNSFHGTAFSIILEKQFWTCTTNIASNRLVSLLSKADLESRLINGESEIVETQCINFSNVQAKLQPYIEESKNYLINSIKQ